MPQFVVYHKLNKSSIVSNYHVDAKNADAAREKAKEVHKGFVHYEIVGIAAVQATGIIEENKST